MSIADGNDCCEWCILSGCCGDQGRVSSLRKAGGAVGSSCDGVIDGVTNPCTFGGLRVRGLSGVDGVGDEWTWNHFCSSCDRVSGEESIDAYTVGMIAAVSIFRQ